MVGIICFWDRYATPYLQKYEKTLLEIGLPYEVVLWDRVGNSKGSIHYERNEVVISMQCSRKPVRKILDFLHWRRCVRKVIKERNYDHLIVLTTMPAFLLFGLLLGKYRGKYIFDIRDYTFEKITFLRKIVMRIIRASQLTAISSKGYMRWLEDDPKIRINHNITVEEVVPNTNLKKGARPIRFAFVGNVRLDTQTEALLCSLGERQEFEQHFYGRVLKECKIDQIVREQGYSNVFMHGAFSVEDKRRFFNKIDLLNAVYANCEKDEDIPLGDSTPLPNRLYDALVFKKPLVASRGTYLAELIHEFDLGCVVNGFETDAGDRILQYVDTFDPVKFNQGAERLLKIVSEEEKVYMADMTSILLGWKR